MERLNLKLSEETVRLARRHGADDVSAWVERAIQQAAVREMLQDYRALTDELGVNTPEFEEAALREREELRRAPR